MYAIDVEFKGGKKLEGLVWRWFPEKGYFEALDESNGKINKYRFSDVKSGIFYTDRIRKFAKQEDLLDRAREHGYQG
jgi:hypothetical protein